MTTQLSHPLHNGIRRLRKALGTAILFLTLGLRVLPAQAPPAPEYQVKAVFLYNFTQFVEWPSTAFAQANAPLVIGVLGDDPFGAYLDETVVNEQAKGHPLVVRRYRNVREVKDCHLLFVNSNDQNQIKEILSQLSNRNILTVGDHGDFARMGGMVRFKTVDNKIRFQINPTAAKLAKLNISSKLLRVAEIYDQPTP